MNLRPGADCVCSGRTLESRSCLASAAPSAEGPSPTWISPAGPASHRTPDKSRGIYIFSVKSTFRLPLSSFLFNGKQNITVRTVIINY